jgi:heme/copper-type cytochrome/quinol oxidase subunit 3
MVCFEGIHMNMFLISAAILSVFVCLLHTFAGGRAIAVPLLKATDLHPVPKYVAYYCWHIVTIVLAMISVMFAVAAMRAQSMDLAWVATALTASFCLLGLVVPPMKKQRYKDMPQGWLFLPIFVLGVLGGVA